MSTTVQTQPQTINELNNYAEQYLRSLPVKASAVLKEGIHKALLKGCKFVTSPSELLSTNVKATYTCHPCQEVKTQVLKDMFRGSCRSCNSYMMKVVPSDHSILKTAQQQLEAVSNELWYPVTGGWVSSAGRAVSAIGAILQPDPRHRFHLAGKLQYLDALLQEGRKNGFVSFETTQALVAPSASVVAAIVIPETLPQSTNESQTEDSSVSLNSKKRPRVKLNSIKGYVEPTGPNFVHQSKDQTDQELCEQLKQQLNFKAYLNLTVFINGSVYNNRWERFVTFAESHEGDKKQGYYFFTSDGMSYRLHRLVCFLFNPKEGRNTLNDYAIFECNHKDGNKHNNHANNLEWTTHSENMRHAYDTGLNAKNVRAMLQYEYVPANEGGLGKLVRRFPSVAVASKLTQTPEHEIRRIARDQMKPTTFVWKYEDESKNEEWSKKFRTFIKTSERLTTTTKAAERYKVAAYMKNNDNSKGTLFGIFDSCSLASKATGASAEVIRCACKEGKIPTKVPYLYEALPWSTEAVAPSM